MNEKKVLNPMATFAVLSVFLMSQSAFIVNPALANLAQKFPSVPFSAILLISTLVTLMVVPFSIVSGAVAGKKIKYKTVAIISILCIAIGGILPYFLQDFYMILATRVIVGIGVGLSSPLGNAIVMQLYNKDKAAGMQGMGTAVMNISGIVLQTVAGYVCVINVNYVWLVHLIMLIPLILALFFLPEPEKSETTAEGSKKKVKLKASVYIVSLAYGILFMLYYPMLLNMSSILVKDGIGTAATAGIILSFYTVGGMVAGFLFGKFFKLTGKFVIPISLFIWIIGLAIGYFSESSALFMLAAGLTGFSIFTIWPACIMDFGEILPPEGVSAAAGIFTACIGIGGFLSSSYSSLVTSLSGTGSLRAPILVGLIGTIIITIVWTITKLSKKSDNSAKNADAV